MGCDLDPAYAVTALPSYAEELASNPFLTFAAIPPDSRYRFLLDEPKAPPATAEAPKDIAATFESIQGNVKTRGVGGLDWKDVQPLVQSHLGDLPVKVFVYTLYQRGVKASEA